MNEKIMKDIKDMLKIGNSGREIDAAGRRLYEKGGYLKYMVCPFEMALDMSLFSDAIICDYNYVFDPNVYLKRFFGEGVSGDYLFLKY